MDWGRARWELVCCAFAAGLAASTCLHAQSSHSSQRTPKSSSFASLVGPPTLSLKDKSVPADKTAGPAAEVFAQLLHELPDRTSSQVHWELRKLRDANAPQGAFVFPDGGVYVGGEMARLLDGNAGLWAALLSHEVAHVILYHWTKLAAMQDLMADARDDWKFLTPNALSLSIWLQPTAQETQEELAAFSRDLEMDADAAGLKLMAQAGFHPDFMTALYHLMQVQDADSAADMRFCLTHPGWNTRESRLRKKLSAAVAEFNRRWPDAAQSPGGKAPVLAFTERPEVNVSLDRENAEVSFPLRCENSTGQTKVVLLIHHFQVGTVQAQESGQLQQSITCTANQTVVRFDVRASGHDDDVDAELYVMDDRGAVLARSPVFRVEY
jgi:hypothetical protein